MTAAAAPVTILGVIILMCDHAASSALSEAVDLTHREAIQSRGQLPLENFAATKLQG